jgi:WD40 repeat protein
LAAFGFRGRQNSIAITSDGKRAVFAGSDKTLVIWDFKRNSTLHTLKASLRSADRVVVSAGETRVVSASFDGKLEVWDPAAAKSLYTLEGRSDFVSGLAVTADGKRALSTSWDKTLKVWDLEEGALITTFRSDAEMWCCAIDPGIIVAGDFNGGVHFLHLEEDQK